MPHWKTVVRFPILLSPLCKLGLGLTKSAISHYPMIFPAADLPHTRTIVVAFCFVSVMKMI